jgi:hypothetical protein
MTMLRSDPLEEVPLAAGPFPDPDIFTRYAITFERDLVNRQT